MHPRKEVVTLTGWYLVQGCYLILSNQNFHFSTRDKELTLINPPHTFQKIEEIGKASLEIPSCSQKSMEIPKKPLKTRKFLWDPKNFRTPQRFSKLLRQPPEVLLLERNLLAAVNFLIVDCKLFICTYSANAFPSF